MIVLSTGFGEDTVLIILILIILLIIVSYYRLFFKKILDYFKSFFYRSEWEGKLINCLVVITHWQSIAFSKTASFFYICESKKCKNIF